MESLIAGPALVTGASSGIGAAVVRGLRERGTEVVAVARRAERLQELADETGCQIHVLDVQDRAGVAELGASLPFSLVVNNAGLGRAMGSLVTATADDIDRTIDTNVSSVLHILRAVLPGMIERGDGHVVNIGSMAGHHQLPAAIYGASKAAVHLLSANLRLELTGTGVRVTEIAPGRVATEFYDVAIDDPMLSAKVKASGIAELTPGDIADAIMYAIDTPPHLNINRIELQPTEQTYGGSQFMVNTHEVNTQGDDRA